MKTIALIIPYYGKFPNYFDLWLLSVKYNPSVDFYLVTDIKIDMMSDNERWPLNVHIIDMPFNMLSKRIKSLFDTDIDLKYYKKLCDFKPAYGYIFHEYIEAYDFWGFCDMDLIFGDIRKFVTEEKLERYDKLYALGHLVIVRNTERMNKMCLLEHNYPVYTYKEAWKEPITSHFCEGRGYSVICEREGIDCYDKMDFADINMYQKLFHLVFKGKVSRNKYIFYWNEGKLTGITTQFFDKKIDLDKTNLKEDDFLYVHLQKRVMDNKCEIKQISHLQGFWILPNKFMDDKINTKEVGEKKEESVIEKAKKLGLLSYISRGGYVWYPKAWKVFYSEVRDHILYGGLKLRWMLFIKKKRLRRKKI